MDSSKFGHTLHVKAFSFSDIDIIITDYKNDQLMNKKLSEQGIELVFI